MSSHPSPTSENEFSLCGRVLLVEDLRFMERAANGGLRVQAAGRPGTCLATSFVCAARLVEVTGWVWVIEPFQTLDRMGRFQ
jgi:hypothetical protein